MYQEAIGSLVELGLLPKAEQLQSCHSVRVWLENSPTTSKICSNIVSHMETNHRIFAVL